LFKENFKIKYNEKIEKFCNDIYKTVKPIYFSSFNSNKQKNVVYSMSIILDTLIRRRFSKEFNYMLISRDMSNFSPSSKTSLKCKYNITYHTLINAVEILKQVNIISEKRGYAQFVCDFEFSEKWYQNKNKSALTTLTLNDPLEWNKQVLNISYFDIARIYCYDNSLKSDAIVRYKKQSNIKKNRKIIDEKIIPSTHEKAIRQVNKYLIKNNLSDFKYQRIYSCEIDEDKSIHNAGYGRLYSPFQQIPKDLREKIIEEFNLKEYDIKSCLPNILYFKEKGHKYQGDLYHDAMKACGIKEEHYSIYRDVFKKIFLLMFNIKFEDCEKSIRHLLFEYGLLECEYDSKKLKDNFKNNFDNSFQYLFNPRYLIRFIELAFPEFKNYLFTKSSCYTQFIESKIALEVMSFMVKDNIIPITIHDAYYFPINDFEYYSSLCEDLFYKIISNDINNSYSYNNFNPSFNYIINFYFNNQSTKINNFFYFILFKKIFYYYNTKINLINICKLNYKHVGFT
jgi:hypothetical protein